MKKIILMLIMLLVVSSVHALTVSDITLGGENQERAQTTTETATVTNNGAVELTDLEGVFVGVDENFEITGLLGQTTLAPGESTTITITAYVPLYLDAVDRRGRPLLNNIGSIAIGNDVDSAAANLYMQAESSLEFGSVKLQIDGSSKSVRDGKDFSDIKRGENLDLQIEVENTFSDDGTCDEDGQDCDIEDIEVVVESDGDLDIDEEIDYSSIRANDEDTESFSFDIEEDVDDDDYDVEMWVTGFDENNARHGETWEFTLEVDVPRDEVSIKRYDLEPDTLVCGERRTSLSVTVENVGRSDQDEVSIILDSPKLDVKQSVYNVELDEGDTATRTFDITVPSDILPGRYFIQMIANVDNSDETDRDAASLIIRDCDGDEDEEDEEVEDDGDSVNIIEVPPTAGVIVGKEKKSDFFDSNAYLLMLGVLAVIAILLILILIVVLVKK